MTCLGSRSPRSAVRGAAGAFALAALVACSADPGGADGTSADGDGTSKIEGDIRRVPGVFLQPDSAALSPDGRQFVVPCLDDLCVWNTADGSLHTTYPGSKDVAWSPDGDLIATSDVVERTASVVLLDAETGDEVRSMSGHDVEEIIDGVGLGISDLGFSPDGTTVASAGGDGAVRLWSVTDGESQAVLETESETPDALAFSPDGSRLAVAAPDASVEIWDTGSGERVGTLDAEPQGEVTWSPDGRLLATDTNAADATATVRLWDASSLEEEDSYSDPVQADGLAFSPDSTTLAMSQKDDDTVLLWTFGSGDTRTLSGHEEPPRAVLWGPDGTALYSVSARDGVVQWDTATGDVARRFDPPEG